MEKSTSDLIKEGIAKATTYQQYRDLVAELALTEKSTGPVQTEDLANYTKLNDQRMKRWDKVVKVDAAATETIQKMDKKVTWLVLTESWCGDAAPALPVMHKIANLNPNIKLHVILRDENVDLMNKFLTNGGMSIPKLIILDDASGSVVNTWGPRSKNATKLVEDHRAVHGTILPELKEEIQVWYNKDKGQSILEDLLLLL